MGEGERRGWGVFILQEISEFGSFHPTGNESNILNGWNFLTSCKPCIIGCCTHHEFMHCGLRLFMYRESVNINTVGLLQF